MFKKLLGCFMLLALSISTVVGQLNYNGPFSSDVSSPTALTLSAGVNVISNTVMTPPSVSNWFDLTLPSSAEITAITFEVNDPLMISSGTICFNPTTSCIPSDTWTSGGQAATPVTAWDFPGTLPVVSSPGLIQVISNVASNTTWTLTLTVVDNDPCASDSDNPVAVCQDITVELDTDGNASITANEVDNGSTDNCTIASLSVSPNTVDCDDLGAPVTVTLTVTDDAGNFADCSADVTVEDNLAPVIVCQDVTIEIPADGAPVTTNPFITGGLVSRTDNCNLVGSINNTGPSNVTCSNVGSYTQKIFQYDLSGNVITCLLTVTIEDNILPNALCQDITVALDANGEASITTADIDGGSSDNCGFELSLSSAAFDCNDLDAPVTVTLTVTDDGGNEADCPAIVTVVDDEDPMLTCQDVIAELDDNGEVSVTADQFVISAADNCTVGSPFFRGNPNTDYTCSDIGQTYTLRIRVKDQSENKKTCQKTVTIVDNIAPEFTCPTDFSVDTDAGVCEAVVDFTVSVSDNCGIFDTQEYIANGDFETGDLSSWTISNTGGTNVEINDGANTSSVFNSGNAFAPISGSFDLFRESFGPAISITSQGMVIPSNVSSATLSWNDRIATNAGNWSEPNQDVRVLLLDASMSLITEVYSTTPGDALSQLGPNSRSFDLTATLQGLSGQMVYVSFEVEDNLGILLFSLDDVSLQITTENPLVVNQTAGLASGAVYPLGTTTNTFETVDGSGNPAVCTFVVTVEDNETPEALCQDVTVQLDAAGAGSTTAAAVDNGSNDACGIASLVLSQTAFDCSNVGANTVDLTVTDNNNNESTCAATVTVEDNVAAEALCQDVTVQLDAAGAGSTTAAAVDNGSNDACGVATLALSQTDFDCSEVGTNAVVLTVTDNNNNVSTCDAVVTVEDNLAPIMTCPDVTINLDPGFCGAIVTYEVDATDNCGVASNVLVSGPASGTYLDYHDSSWDVLWEAIDVNGNATQCAFTIEMFEFANPTPVLTCNDNVQISIDPQGSGILGADMMLEGGPYGCYDDYIVTIDGASNELNCTMVGEGTIMVMVEDPDTGNTCWGSIIVEDKIGPNCVAVSDYTVDCEEGLPSDADPVYWPTFGDNCAVADVTLVSETVLNSDICTDITVERVWTAVDASGNAALTNCTQTITITRGSILLPTDIDFECSNYIIEDLVPALTGFPEGAATSCGYSYAYTDTEFDGCGSTGVITRTWSILDECSNAVTTHVQTIALIDTQGPSISYNDITVSANETAEHPLPCLSTANIPTNAAVSDCSDVVSVRYFTSVGEVLNGVIPEPGLPIGDHTLTITAEDACGNVSSEDFTITVIDGIAPTTICKEITTVALTSNGAAVVPAESFDNGTYDNCCLDYFEVRRMDDTAFGPTVSFDCEDEAVTVVFRAWDCNEYFNDCMVEVLVEDKIGAFCFAPANAAIDCDDYYTNYAPALDNGDYAVLEAFGIGSTGDNCDYTDDYAVTYNVDQCGIGTITRTWSAQDAAGNAPASCTQTISVSHVSDWTVSFPADFDQPVNADCDYEDIDFGSPSISNDECEMIAVSYTDTQFDVPGQDACFKIFRDWTVINWCTYDGDDNDELVASQSNLIYNAEGDEYVTYKQVIKVKDDVAPTVSVENITTQVSATSCFATFAQADVDAIAIEDGCDTDAYVITENYGDLAQYLNVFTAQFEDVPAGTYEVTFTVADPCGNTGTAIKIVVVEEKAPTAFCTDELVIDLMTTGMAEVNAADFNFASSDNCTADADLSFAFSSDINNTVMTVTCDDLGNNAVEMWVFDADGLTDFCAVTLTVQNNNGADCGTGSLTVAGVINTENADAVAEVEVEVNGGLFATTTDTDGMFSFDLAQGGDYTVAPAYDANIENGVTTFDIVKITQHILGIQSLGSAYKVIAADANNSASVTTLDIVAIRKVILQIEESFPNNTSWRFVDAAYVFADAMNPWGFAEVANFNNLDTDALTTDFVAVKIGDVTGDAQTSFGSADDRTMNGVFGINAKEVAMTAGNTYEVTFTADAAVEGFQFTMNFDADKVAFAGLTEGVATEKHFGFAKLNKGAITTSWNAEAAYDFAGADVFTVSFTALEDVNLSDVVSINSRFTAAEAYAAGDLQDVELTFSGAAANNYALYQNTPNPFKGETVIAFELAQAGEAVVTIMDVNGKVVRTINGDFAKGFNNVTVKDINTTGVLYYTLESGDFTATKKMIIID